MFGNTRAGLVRGGGTNVATLDHHGVVSRIYAFNEDTFIFNQCGIAGNKKFDLAFLA